MSRMIRNERHFLKIKSNIESRNQTVTHLVSDEHCKEKN